MQLNMITPMDIGLERQDGVDDSDMFDLGEVEGGPVRRGVKGGMGEFGEREIDSGDEFDSEEEEEEDLIEEGEEGEDDEDEDEEEKKTQRLEQSLDALYDQFQQHKIERDAKHKAKEERRKRDAAEGGEWAGIKTAGESDDDESDVDADPAPLPSDDDDSDEEDATATAAGMDVDGEEKEGSEEVDEDDDDDDEIELDDGGRGIRSAAPTPQISKRAVKAANLAAAKVARADAKLLTKLVKPITDEKRTADKSRQAKMWFDQPVFKGLKGLEQLMTGDGEEEEGDREDDEDDEVDMGEVSGVWEEMGQEEEEAEAKALAVSSLGFFAWRLWDDG